jgi:hypothetical protein
MSTVAAVIDRVYRDYLYPASDRPAMSRLTTTVTNAGTSIVYNPGLFTPEEEALLGAGSLIEIGCELMLIIVPNIESRTLTVVRGQNGTTAAIHTAGDSIYVAPVYPRQVVFDAVADNVVRLYPTLWAVETDAITTDTIPVELESDAVEIIKFMYPDTDTISGSTRWMHATASLLTDFPYVTSTVAIQFHESVPSGRAGYLTYKRKFPRPTVETDDLTISSGTFLLLPQWERIIAVGAAVDVISARDIDLATQEFITETAAAESFPVGSGEKIRNSLIRYYEYLISQAQRDLRHRYPPGMEYTDTGIYGV